ncbi:hypothetical protein BT96DRAFT_957543 [Gymnopus androsaceus JB14]|uniref:AIG1-type G domain-containing protein n=1 Tax=Gymnopus androsaceus JB14 TaxID=1447944 RepID=A0A6A4HNE5_9AGAR|nr:hypothetical protein BT96DRAFT_957543 [Gymnopus androsaceus JB14]
MGPTGSGKSTFINKACQTEEMVVGKGLESCTAVVASSKQFQLNGRTVVLIDTPGFDDTNRSDAEILGDISVYLTAAYEYGVRLTGVLYLHRISDNRVSGLTRRNMKMFQKMCGPEAMNNVIIVTNMWGGVDGSVGQLRETELQSNNAFLAEAMKKGAQMRRHDDTHRSACDIISELLKNDPVTLKIQTEIVYENKNLLDTEAGNSAKPGVYGANQEQHGEK